MNIVTEYRRSLKMAEAEEILDLVFYRPIAFVFVKLIYRLPITPNQMTLLALVAGLVSSCYFSLGEPALYAFAALWYAIANTLDCGDGMLARLQHSGSPLGRLVDGVVDWVSSVAIFAGLGIGLTAQTGDPKMWILAVAGGLTSAMHAVFFDYYQQEFISNVRGEKNFLDREVTKITAEMEILKQEHTNIVRRMVLSLYLRYLSVQQRSQFKQEAREQFPPELYRSTCGVIMRWWTHLGPTTNRTLLMVAALFQQPVYFLWLVIIPGNLYLLFMLVWQRKIQRRLERAVRHQPVVAKEAVAKV